MKAMRVASGIVCNEVLQKKPYRGPSPADQHIVPDACPDMPGGSER